MNKKELVNELTKVAKDNSVEESVRADALQHLTQLKAEHDSKRNQITFNGKPINDVHAFLGNLNGTIDDMTYKAIQQKHWELDAEYGPFEEGTVFAL